MGTLLQPGVITALVTAAAGVLLFGLAAYLPKSFPHWAVRLVGLFTMASSLFPVYVYTERRDYVYLVGGIGLGLMVMMHLVQVAVRPSPSSPMPPETPEETPAAPPDEQEK
jgi:hypothetical protein